MKIRVTGLISGKCKLLEFNSNEFISVKSLEEFDNAIHEEIEAQGCLSSSSTGPDKQKLWDEVQALKEKAENG